MYYNQQQHLVQHTHNNAIHSYQRFHGPSSRPPVALASKPNESVYNRAQSAAFGGQGRVIAGQGAASPVRQQRRHGTNTLLHHTGNLLVVSSQTGERIRGRDEVLCEYHAPATPRAVERIPQINSAHFRECVGNQSHNNLQDHNEGAAEFQRTRMEMANFVGPFGEGLMDEIESFSAVPDGSSQLAAQAKMMAMQNMQNAEHFAQTGISRGGVAKKAPRPDSYKTVMCQAWLESKMCNFGENCRFAHGERELRPCRIQPKSNNKYKTKLCDKYTTTGLCPYGTRCLFIHPDNNGSNSNAYIRPDKLPEIAHKHAEAERRKLVQNGLDPEELPVHVELPGETPPLSLLSETPVRGTGLGARLGLRPHPSWPLEPVDFFHRELLNQKEQNMLKEILSDLDFASSMSSTDHRGMDLLRRTPSPVPCELLAKEVEYGTPGSRISDYSSGDASPAGSSLFDSQSPYSMDSSPFSSGVGGSSPFSCGSSAVSISGDGFDVHEDSLFMRELPASHIVSVEGEEVAHQKPKIKQTQQGLVTERAYDPFTFALGTDNLAREMCKNFDNIW